MVTFNATKALMAMGLGVGALVFAVALAGLLAWIEYKTNTWLAGGVGFAILLVILFIVGGLSK